MKNLKHMSKSFFSAVPVPFAGARMEVFSNKKAVVEGCTGILEYKKEKVIIKIDSSMNICFDGRDLHVCCMDKDSLVVEGMILSISYIRRGDVHA